MNLNDIPLTETGLGALLDFGRANPTTKNVPDCVAMLGPRQGKSVAVREVFLRWAATGSISLREGE